MQQSKMKCNRKLKIGDAENEKRNLLVEHKLENGRRPIYTLVMLSAPARVLADNKRTWSAEYNS